jgi:NADH-quinone oxidoreductase subunit J
VQRHVLFGTLSLILMLTAMSALFVLLQASFLAVINVIVYAGAIMVLFVFVIMLLNLAADAEEEDRLRWLKLAGIPMVIFLMFVMAAVFINIGDAPAEARLVGSPEAIGASLFTDYILPFELTSLLILIALMGAVVFAKKDL